MDRIFDKKHGVDYLKNEVPYMAECFGAQNW